MENIEYSKNLLDLAARTADSSAAKIKKSDLLQILKNHDEVLGGLSAIYAYIDLMNREIPKLKVIDKNGITEISLGVTQDHISLSKEYLSAMGIPENTKTKELYLDTKQDSRAERIEFILG